MAFETPGTGALFLLGRGLFALVLGHLALGNLLGLEESVAYARSKGAPAPAVTVPLTSLALLGGAAAILFGAYPLLGAGAIVAFLVGITPVMHDFWNEEGQARENERIHFLKNVGLLGSALAFAVLAGLDWPYALGVGL